MYQSQLTVKTIKIVPDQSVPREAIWSETISLLIRQILLITKVDKLSLSTLNLNFKISKFKFLFVFYVS